MKKESEDDKEYVSADDLTLKRKDGIWKLFVPIKFSNWKESHNWFVDFKEIDCPLPQNLVAYNSLCIPFEKVKASISDAKDAVSSPDGKLLVVQTKDKIKVLQILCRELISQI